MLSAEQKADLRTVQLPDRLVMKGVDCTTDLTKYLRELTAKWMVSGRISEVKQGFGYATTGVITWGQLMTVDPEDLLSYIAAAFADNGAPERVMWNAVRKIYALLQVLKMGHDVTSTLEAKGLMLPTVPGENSDKTILFGPFSHGGAYLRRSGKLVVIDAVSIYKAEEDHGVARRSTKWQLKAYGAREV